MSVADGSVEVLGSLAETCHVFVTPLGLEVRFQFLFCPTSEYVLYSTAPVRHTIYLSLLLRAVVGYIDLLYVRILESSAAAVFKVRRHNGVT